MNPLLQPHVKWLIAPPEYKAAVPLFWREFHLDRPVFSATLHITARGVYNALINGKAVTDYRFAPGWTSFENRLQYQSYDVTELLTEQNRIEVSVGQGWFIHYPYDSENTCIHTRLLAALELTFTDGSTALIPTDDTWKVQQCAIRTSHFYFGETVDDTFVPDAAITPAIDGQCGKETLIAQQGEFIREIMQRKVAEVITTPKGETVLDFGQNLTGYVRFYANVPRGTELMLHHAEVLDAEGNFYTENYRKATNEIRYVSAGTPRWVQPTHSFQGFRYVRLTGFEKVNPADFVAVVVSSDMRRTGSFSCSDGMVNQLFDNIVWGQLGNFLDVPTDCPQRDERLGWTGDAQVFAHVATFNFDTRKFYDKWLTDLAADQSPDGLIPTTIPRCWKPNTSPAWGDAATIVPWQVYLTYGDRKMLARQFDSMKKWVDYTAAHTTDFVWHRADPELHSFGDWLGLDAEPGSYKGSTDETLIGTAFFAYSTELLVKAGIVLGKDMTDYKLQLHAIREAFRKQFIKDGRLLCDTQTSCVLTLFFNLCKPEDKPSVTRQLTELIRRYGHLTTGFVGTPYLLHALSQNGETELAYELLLRREYPGWLYPITKGATTMWEHWDGIKPDGSMWSPDMNSFNHYAYGAVGDWLYGVVCGIQRDEKAPGFENIIFAPQPSKRLHWAKAEIDTAHGKIKSEWERLDDGFRHKFTVPAGCTAIAHIDGTPIKLGEGEHVIFDRDNA
ncbi:MAG: family 78 glycoside hydrolase catalytic domain [Clostridia bacterium]|nr:family 78 glycoside hydrolase catalytic domain [Clostridia bacterium]